MNPMNAINECSFDAEILPYERLFENRRWDATAADVGVLSSAVELLAERAYKTEDGVVRVRFDWQPLLERCLSSMDEEAEEEADEKGAEKGDEEGEDEIREDPPVLTSMQFVDEREPPDLRDAFSFTNLFLHESFLLLNIAVPGSFGGTMRWSRGQDGDSELVLDARVFENAWVTASRDGWPTIEPLPLASVVAGYDALGIGTQQMAMTGTARALFHLLYLARSAEDDTMSVLRLALSLEALFETRGASLSAGIESLLGRCDRLPRTLQQFFDDRDAMVRGTAPVAHPMYDDGLDPRADDASFDYTGVVDFASSVIVAAIQAQARAHGRMRLVV